MKIVQLTTDNRNQHGRWDLDYPYFGTAPDALFQGFSEIPEAEVHVICCTSRPMKSPEKLAPNVHFHLLQVPKLGWGRSLFLGCTFATRRLIKKINPDIVHGQGTERDCAMEAVHSGYPNVLTIHGNMRVHASREEQKGSRYYKMAAALEGHCLKHTNGVVAISTYTKELVEDITPRTWVLPNAVDRRYFKVEPDPDPKPRILFVGAIGERKNPVGLIKACEPMLRAGECTIAFAGDGDEQSAYWKEFKSLLDTVPGLELLGFIDRDALGLEFRRSSLLVLPTFEDNCPMVVLEAMAAGVPVAASRVGGVPDLIQNEVDGLLFNPEKPEEIREAVRRLLHSINLRQSIAEAGNLTAKTRFHPKIVAEKHLEIYQDVIGSR